MELNTGDLKMISREEYRKAVEKIMRKEMRHAAMGATMCLIEHDGDLDDETLKKIEDATKDALKLQLSVLQSMEEALFGAEKEDPKKDEAKTDD